MLEEVREESLRAMLLEFDKQWAGLTRSVHAFLDDAEEHHAAARNAGDKVRAYITCESTKHNYPSLMSEWRHLQIKRRAAEASLRTTFMELEQHLTLLAKVLVDGGLLRSQILVTLADLPSDAATTRNVPGVTGAGAHHLFTASGIHAVQEYLASRIQSGLPPQLLGQTQAAFSLANHLSLRHGSMGMRADRDIVEAMRMAWTSVQGEYTAFKRVFEDPGSDGSAFKRSFLVKTLETLLPAYAATPASCAGTGDMIVWAELESDMQNKSTRILLLKSATLLQSAVKSG